MNIHNAAQEMESPRDVKGFLLLAASVVIALAVTFPGIPLTAIGGGTFAMLVFSLLAIALALSVLVTSLRTVRSSDASRRWMRWAAAGIAGLSLIPALQWLAISVLRVMT